MRYIFLITILFTILTLNAYEFEVRNFAPDDTDLKNAVGVSVNDMNDDPCSVIRIETDIKSDIFLAGSDVVKREKSAPGEYYFFISFRSTWVKFTAEGYEPYTWQIPVILKPKMTYVLQLTTLGGFKGDLIPIVIISDPPDAKILLNDQPIECGIPQSVEQNTYSVSLEKEGYQTIKDSISVSEENKSFSFQLKPLDPGHFDVATIPDSVRVIVDGVVKGISSGVFDLAYGYHSIELKKNGYVSVYDSLFVESGITYTKSYKLEKDAGILKPKLVPNDAILTINGEIFNHIRPFLLNPGTYRVEVKRDSYISYEDIIMIERNQTKELNIELIPVKGRLNITVNPGKTECFLYDSKMLINSWTGSRSFQSILTGDYTLVCKADGYLTDSLKVRIIPNQLTEKEVTMKKVHFDSRAFSKGQIFDEEKNYPFFTISTDNGTHMYVNEYEYQFYLYTNSTFYLKIIKPLYIGGNYQYNYANYQQDLGLQDLMQKSDDDDFDDINKLVIDDDDQRFSAHALLMYPYRFQPFIWFSQQFANKYDNIKSGIEYTTGIKYFNKDLFIIAARNENNCYVYPFNDMQINTQERIQFFYEHADYSNNWISLILLRDRINPLYATFYSHNHDYFYNAANKTGDLYAKYEMSESKFKSINNESSGLDREVKMIKAEAGIFLFDFLSVNSQFIRHEQTSIFNGLLFSDAKAVNSDFAAESRIHLIQSLAFNLYAGAQFQQHKWLEFPEFSVEVYSDYSRINATTGLMIRTPGIYQNLSIKLHGSFLIQSPDIETYDLDLTAQISASF